MQDKLYINGSWVHPVLGGTLPVINPATEEVFFNAPAGTSADIDLAVSAARDAFENGWGQTSGCERAKYLRAIAREIEKRTDDLAHLEVLDNGKPLPEARWDIEDTAGCFDYYADLAQELDSAQGESVALPMETFKTQIYHEPMGVAGQIIPWNYPLLMAAWKVAPALAAGCTVVLKPSELTPLTALELGVIADAVKLPKGVLNIVTGTGAEAGAPLTQHPGVDKLAFTGSVPTGSRVMAACSQDIKNISLELGGKSPVIVFDDADIEQAVEWIMFGIFWNQGEVCSATSRLLVQDAIAPKLLARLKEEASKITIGDGLLEGTLLGPLVSQGQFDKVMAAIENAKNQKIKLLTGGSRPEGLNRGYFVKPTIFVDVPEGSDLWREETFGPVLSVRSFTDEEDAIRMANDTRFGLAAAVMSKDEKRCQRVARAFRAGIVWINCSQPTFTQAPWGGMKQSGIGRELGRWGLNNYLEVKQVTRYVTEEPWGWYLNKPGDR